MKVALCFFCYKNDAELLDCALRAVPRLRAAGDEVVVYLADDAAAPLESLPGWQVEGVEYMRTGFERRGNLNGAECVRGMVEVYAGIMREGGYDWVIKADCDTVVNGLDWLRGCDADFVGTVHVNGHVSGSCYAISRRGVELLEAALATPRWYGAAERAWCEDKALYNICRCVGGRVEGREGGGNAIGGQLLYHDWLVQPRVPLELLREAAAVDFKACRWNSKRERWQQDAVEGLARMREYVDMFNV